MPSLRAPWNGLETGLPYGFACDYISAGSSVISFRPGWGGGRGEGGEDGKIAGSPYPGWGPSPFAKKQVVRFRTGCERDTKPPGAQNQNCLGEEGPVEGEVLTDSAWRGNN